ncbi:MAG: hypothetical protein MPJ50_05150 [Pirellulales bacterium]|nr:hypothetical protein [Pirellulales bacterium]
MPDSLATRPGVVERFCRYVPLFGWIVATSLESRRIQLVLDSLIAQLEERGANDSVPFTTTERNVTLEQFFADSIKDHFGWPHNHFVCDDPLSLLFYGDDGECLELCGEVERFLELPSGTITAEELHASTFGEAIAKLLQYKPQC